MKIHPHCAMCTRRQILVLLAAGALCLSAAIPSAFAKTIEGVALDENFKPAERAASMLEIANTNSLALKDIKRVAISSFQVEFVTKGAASASSYEIGKSGRANTNVHITLVGLAQPDFQAITDQLHGEFVRDLAAMKIEVVPTELVLKAAAYQKMASSGKPSPAETRTSNTWSTVYAPAGLGVYGLGASSTTFALVGGFSAMSDVLTTMTGNLDLAKELDATLVVVRLVVNFVDMKSSNSSWFGRSSGEAKVAWEFGPSVAAKSSFMSVTSQTDTVTMTLQAPLLINGSAFKEVKDVSSIAANVGLALLSAAIGKGGSSTAIDKEAVADPEKYRAVVGAGLAAVREMFIERLRAP